MTHAIRRGGNTAGEVGLSPMEDYSAACKCRYEDVNALLATDPKRSIAAVHLGGVAVECQLKAFVLKYHSVGAWGEPGKRPKDPRRGQPIERPGHGLIAVLRMMPKVFEKATTDHQLMRHLSQVMHPAGSSQLDFIDLRYSAQQMTEEGIKSWHRSLAYVNGWLEKNGVFAE